MTNTLQDQAAEDRATYELWTLDQERAYMAAGNNFWFDANKATRMRKRGSQAPRDAFTGPYWAAAPFLTQEAIDWFTVANNPRYTFTDWVRMQREHRAAAAEFDAAENDPLATLEYLRDMQDRRGALIAEARAAGASWDDVMTATGLSRMTCHTLAKGHTHPAPAAVVEPAESADDVAMREHAAARGYATWAEYAAVVEAGRAA